jgi:hypothetical protein
VGPRRSRPRQAAATAALQVLDDEDQRGESDEDGNDGVQHSLVHWYLPLLVFRAVALNGLPQQ